MRVKRNDNDISKIVNPYQSPRDSFTAEDNQAWEITKATCYGSTTAAGCSLLYLFMQENPATTAQLYSIAGLILGVGVIAGFVRSLKL